MKTSIKREPAGFQPVTVEITLETPEECEGLYQLANYGVRSDLQTVKEKTVPVEGKLWCVLRSDEAFQSARSGS